MRTNTQQHKMRQKKPKHPPPIVVHGKLRDHNEVMQSLQKEIKKGFHVTHTQNNTSIHVYDTEEYRRLKAVLENDQVDFHTYTEKENKTYAFVLRGLDTEPEKGEIEKELVNVYKLPVVTVYKMNTKKNSLYTLL
ncbi:hypothetical protein RI129_004947 [Pyrocoelia pectoralis]|uniref:Uncharacterized protein n=1 Tax=Pyrocoelia pectoralis TaxID=417401 RepID=A0AAN7VIN2_9COLE